MLDPKEKKEEEYDISGLGSSPEEDDFIVVPDEPSHPKPEGEEKHKSFLESLMDGPIDISGTGATDEESDFTAV